MINIAQEMVASDLFGANERYHARNQQIVQMRMDGRTLKDIGAFFEVTRERVRQICVQANCVKSRIRYCVTCGGLRTWSKNGKGRQHRAMSGKLCLRCYEDQIVARRLSHRVPLICECCGAAFERVKSKIHPTSPGRFCSQRCLGRFNALKYGLGTRINRGGRL